MTENQPDELTALRKLASERLDRVTELAAENGELKHQLNGVVQELTEAQNGYNDHVALSRRLTAERDAAQTKADHWVKRFTETLDECDAEEAAKDAKHELLVEAWDDRDSARREAHSLSIELTTAREDTRRAERDWTKALAERDEARAQRDAAQTELETAHSSLASERQERIEWQGCAKGLESECTQLRRVCDAYRREARDDGSDIAKLKAELETVRAELKARKASTSGYTHDLLNREILDHKTTRAALSTLEQAAHALVAFYGLDHLESAELNKRIQVLERALNEVSK